MTQDEKDIRTGRLIRKYNDTLLEMASLRGRINEVHRDAEAACSELRTLHAGNVDEIRTRFADVPWADIGGWLDELARLEEDRTRQESYLSDAGLENLI